MIQAGRRGLNEAQSPLSYHPLPVDGNLGMAHKDVCLEDGFADPFLAGIQESGARGRPLQPLQVLGLYRIAESDIRHRSIPG